MDSPFRTETPLAEFSKRASVAASELAELDAQFSDDTSENELFTDDNQPTQARPGSPPSFTFSDEEYPWVHPAKEKQFQSDWALVEEWIQDLTTNVKMNNEVVKTEVKKVGLFLV